MQSRINSSDRLSERCRNSLISNRAAEPATSGVIRAKFVVTSPSIDIEPSKHGKDAERRYIAILVNRRAK